MAPWLAFVEAYLVKRLLQSPSFHRAVHKVHKGVHRMRNGIPPEEMGGTKIDNPSPGFVNHFLDELREQAGRPKGFQTPSQPTSTKSTPSQSRPRPQHVGRDEPVHDSRQQQPEGGFVSHFVDELRQQFRGGGKGR